MSRSTVSRTWIVCVLAVFVTTLAGRVEAQSTRYWASAGSAPGCSIANSPDPAYVGPCTGSGGCAGTGGVFSTTLAHSNKIDTWASTEQTRYGGWNSCGGGWMSGAESYRHVPVVFTGPAGAVTPTLNVAWEATWDWTLAGTPPAVGAFVRIWGYFGTGPSHGLAYGQVNLGNNFNNVVDWNTNGSAQNPFATVVQIGPNTWKASGTMLAYSWVGNVAPTPVIVGTTYNISIGSYVWMHNGDFNSGMLRIKTEARVAFPATGPVFNLPPGYSCYSPDGHIVDNQWVDPLPVITQQPQAVGTCPGEDVQLTVTATGSGTLSYQWKKDNVALVDGPTGGGSSIAGATTAILDISDITAADFGSYVVDVTNAEGTRTSNPVSVAQTCVIVTDETTQAFLDGLNTVPGSLVMNDEDERPTLIVPNLTSLGGSLLVGENAVLTTLDAAMLSTVGADLHVENNPQMAVLDLPGLTTVGGDLALSRLLDGMGPPQFPSLTNIGGSAIFNQLCVIPPEFESLVEIGGSLFFTDNCEVLLAVGPPQPQFPSLLGVGGSVVISQNCIVPPEFQSLVEIGGSLFFTDNCEVLLAVGPPQPQFPSLLGVGGDLIFESYDDVDFSSAAVAGNTDISTTGAETVAVQVPGGATSVEMSNDGGSVDVDLPDDAAPAGTPFAVLHVTGEGLDPMSGLDAAGQPSSIDPVSAYAFTLGAPLQGAASLVFELTLASLSTEEQTAVLAAYVAGTLTLTVQADAPGSQPAARAQCAPADPLVPDGCVKVGAFDALGFQLPQGETTGAVTIRIAALVSHFSTYAAAIVTPLPRVPGDADCSGAVNGGDVGAFVLAVLDTEAWADAHPLCNPLNSDSNVDGAVNATDIEPFVICLLNGVCP